MGNGHAFAGTLEPFEVLAECTDEIVFVTDLSMRMLYASSALEAQTGFTAADFQFPQADNPFIHREDADRVAQTLAAFVAGDARVCEPIVNRFLDRWGRTHRYRSVVAKLEYCGQPALLFVCRSLEAPSPEAADDRQYRALVESADDAILRLDNAGRVLFANRRTHELLGYTLLELGQKRLDDVVVARDRGTFTAQLTRAIGARDPLRFSLGLVTRIGEEIVFQAVITPLGQYGHTGELLAILRPTATDARQRRYGST
jgi:PAS domain S-box-containing protein